MWSPGDILSDLDLLALDRACLTDFGATALADKRALACDWCGVRVEQAGYHLWQHQQRKVADAVYAYSGTAWTDYTGAASDATADDIPLTTVFAAPASAALYVGYRDPFRAVNIGVLEAVNAQASVLAVATWSGRWLAVTSLADGTIGTSGKSFSAGGVVGWQRPDIWARRTVNGSAQHWARLTMTSTLTAATACGAINPIVASRLSLPCAYQALGMLYQESYGSNRGAWQEKSAAFFQSAQESLVMTLPLIADEFDTDNTDSVSRSEVSSVSRGTDFATWERG